MKIQIETNKVTGKPVSSIVIEDTDTLETIKAIQEEVQRIDYITRDLSYSNWIPKGEISYSVVRPPEVETPAMES